MDEEQPTPSNSQAPVNAFSDYGDTDEDIKAKYPYPGHTTRMVWRLKRMVLLPNFYISSIGRRIARIELAIPSKAYTKPPGKWSNKKNRNLLLIGCSPALRTTILKITQAERHKLFNIWADEPRGIWYRTADAERCLAVPGTNWVPDPQHDLRKPSVLKIQFGDEEAYQDLGVRQAEMQTQEGAQEEDQDDSVKQALQNMEAEIADDLDSQGDSEEREFGDESPVVGGKRKAKMREFARKKNLTISQAGLTIREPRRSPPSRALPPPGQSDFSRRKKQRPPKEKIVPDTKNKMILRRLRAQNAPEEDIRKAEEAVERDIQREKKQKEKETAARKAKNDKKKEAVLQDIKKRADDCIGQKWDPKKAAVDEAWEKIPRGSISWYQMHVINKHQQLTGMQAVTTQNLQNRDQRVEMSQPYLTLKQDLDKVNAAKTAAEQEKFKAEKALADVKREARANKGEMLALKSAAADTTKRYGENLVALEELKIEHGVLNQTLENYEKENKALKQEREAVLAARAEAESFEKEIRTSLLMVRQGYSSEVAEQLVKNRNEVNQLKDELARLKNAYQGEVNTGKAYHELAKSFKAELAVEKAKSSVLTERVEMLEKQVKEHDPVEEEAQRIQNRRFGIVVDYSAAFLKQSFLNYNPSVLQSFKDVTGRFFDNLLGKVLRELTGYVTSEIDRVLEVPDINQIEDELRQKAGDVDDKSRYQFISDEQERTLRDLEERRVQSRQALEEAKEVARKAQMDLDKLELAVLQAGGTTTAAPEEAESTQAPSDAKAREEETEELEEGEVREDADESADEEQEKGDEDKEEKPTKKDDDGKDNYPEDKGDEDDDDEDKGGAAGAVQEPSAENEEDVEPEKPRNDTGMTEQGQDNQGPGNVSGDGSKEEEDDKEEKMKADAGKTDDEQRKKVWTQSPEHKAEFTKRLEAKASEVVERVTEVKNVIQKIRETVIKEVEKLAEEEKNIQRDENGEIVIDYNDPNDI